MKPSKRTLDVTRKLAGGMGTAEYLENPVACPYCRQSDSFKVDDLKLGDSDKSATRRIGCHRCGKYWVDEYKLIGITELPDDFEIEDD